MIDLVKWKRLAPEECWVEDDVFYAWTGTGVAKALWLEGALSLPMLFAALDFQIRSRGWGYVVGLYQGKYHAEVYQDGLQYVVVDGVEAEGDTYAEALFLAYMEAIDG